jgi:hypothetical protein
MPQIPPAAHGSEHHERPDGDCQQRGNDRRKPDAGSGTVTATTTRPTATIAITDPA